jgi:uncharacterized Zn-binding protein involved in type VI secretion
MGNPVARLGDPSNHNGQIISASTNVFADGKGVARQGDQHSCPIEGHGVTNLTSIVTKDFVNGKLVITVGARAGCGAVISAGSPTVAAG